MPDWTDEEKTANLELTREYIAGKRAWRIVARLGSVIIGIATLVAASISIIQNVRHHVN